MKKTKSTFGVSVSQIDVSDGNLIVFIGSIIVGISLGLLTNAWVTSKGNQGTAQWYFIGKLKKIGVSKMSEYELTDIEKKNLDNWIMLNIFPQKTPNKNYTSYTLKTFFEQTPDGFFITNKQFKEAMVRCNFLPVNKNKLNWEFRISLK